MTNTIKGSGLSLEDVFSKEAGLRVYLKVKEKLFSTLMKTIPPDIGFQPYTGDDNEGGEG